LRKLPDWLYPPIIKDTTEVLRFQHENGLTSEIKSLTTTEAGAQSKTPDLLILDETCWNPYVRKIYNASKPGIDAAGGRIIVISNSIKTAPGWAWTRQIFTEAVKGINGFKYIFMPWQDRPGRPPDFREKQVSEGMHPQDVVEHYPETIEEAVSALSGSFFGDSLGSHEKTLFEGIRGNPIEDKQKEISFEDDKTGVLEMWRWPYYEADDWNGHYYTNRYAIGSDVSEGLGQTYSVAYVIDRKLDELVARLRSNRIDAADWAKWLWLLSKWYSSAINRGNNKVDRDPALICVERTGAGQTTVKELEKLNANQYVRIIPGKLGSGITKEFGWHETEQSKYELCGDLRTWFRNTKGGFYCSLLFDEASTTIKHEGTRRIGPEDETKLWDCVVAAGCTLQASNFLEGPPEKIEGYPTGWLKQWKDEGEQASVWAR
jgi:hypothetical protein